MNILEWLVVSKSYYVNCKYIWLIGGNVKLLNLYLMFKNNIKILYKKVYFDKKDGYYEIFLKIF